MLPPSAVGITRASQAETMFCKMLNMKGATWDWLVLRLVYSEEERLAGPDLQGFVSCFLALLLVR